MANGISFNISAVDKATKTINKVNDSVSKMIRPYSNLSKSIKNFTDISGLNKLAGAFGKIKDKIGSAASTLAKFGAPLLALVGGGTIAGLAEMVSNFAKMGAELERTSQLLGVSAQNLNAMRGAAQMMGVSGDDMTSGFKSLADTLQDAKWGRNQAAYTGLMALGITLKETKTGAIDTEQAMLDLADRIHKIQKVDPAAARNLARMFGVENLLPMLSKGSAAMRAYQSEAKRLKGVFTPEMAARATDFSIATSKMMLSIEGVKTSISDKLMPVIQPLMTQFTEWIAKNRELISTKVAQYVERLALWVKSVDWEKFLDGVRNTAISIGDFVSDLVRFIDKIGGVKTLLIGLGVYMAGGFVLSIVTTAAQIVFLAKAISGLDIALLPMLGRLGSIASLLSQIAIAAYAAHKALEFFDPNDNIGSWIDKHVPGAAAVDNFASKFGMGRSYAQQNLADNQSYAMKKLMSMGWSKEQASGLVANFTKESTFDVNASGDDGSAYGIGQWHPDRQAAFKKWAGKDIHGSSLDEQLAFANYELTQGSEQKAGKALRGANDAYQAGAIVSSLYERPANADKEANERGQLAVNVQNTVHIDKNGSATITTKTPSTTKVERVMAEGY